VTDDPSRWDYLWTVLEHNGPAKRYDICHVVQATADAFGKFSSRDREECVRWVTAQSLAERDGIIRPLQGSGRWVKQ